MQDFDTAFDREDLNLIVEPQPGPSANPDDWDNRASVPATIEEGQVWIRRHPVCELPSGFQTAAPDTDHTTPALATNRPKRPPHHPFATLYDFEQAELLIKQGASDGFIDAQLKLNARRFGTQGQHKEGMPENVREFHKLLSQAAPAENLMFETHEIISEFKGITFSHKARNRCLWDAITEVLQDPDLCGDIVWLPVQRFVRSRLSVRPTPTLEESWHGQDWWNAQLRVGPAGRIIYLHVYMDATHLTIGGGVKVWPVYVWLGNIPAEIRKRRGKGGAALVAYLPVVHEDRRLDGATMAELRAHVYQEGLVYIFESIRSAIAVGKLVRCSDGITRRLFLLAGAICVDYEELMKILALLGAKSGFPCPICLVPRELQGDLSGTQWPLRTYNSTIQLHEQADNAKTKTAAKAIRSEQSLRKTKSYLLTLLGPDYSLYDAIATVDPLHQIEQGIFGHHMWPKLKAILGPENCGILDQRFKDIPVYPGLKHFPNGVTPLHHLQGYEHATILRLLAPLIEDLLPEEYKKATLKTIRALARIHLLIKLTTHTDETLEILDMQIKAFGGLWKDFSEQFDTDEAPSDVSAAFPKLHILSHAPDMLRRKSTSDNYETGVGEGLHPQSKDDYETTNHQLGYEDQMLQSYRERETIKQIGANICRHTQDEDEPARQKNNSNDNPPRVEVGSKQHRLATRTFIEQLPHSHHQFEQQLQIFLYENVLKLGTNRIPSSRKLPSLNDTYVIPCHLLRVAYVSLLDSRDGLDLIRSAGDWRKTGPRCDYVIVQDGEEGDIWFAQLVHIFVLRFNNIPYSIAYIRRFHTRSRRSALTGYIELDDRDEYAFIFVDSIVRSCIVLSPGAHENRLVVADLNDPDMFFRLLDL
ncbi:hypothetical protein FRC12_006384 [Ceratobasidium sp. 428]|nr:hypothetical protein FRC12_006384 [Ceratobasidium sp. 428]